jgi:hypothetical protein
MTPADPNVVQIAARGRSVKRLGAWTAARRFDVRASRSLVVLDLLLPGIECRRLKDRTGSAAAGGRLHPAA